MGHGMHMPRSRGRPVGGRYCYWNSRRLPEVWDQIQLWSARRLERARTISTADTEGSEALAHVLQKMLGFLATHMKNRTKYFNIPPWSYSQAKTIAGTKEFLAQVSRKALDLHDGVTQGIIREFGTMLQRRADGGELAEELEESINTFNMAHLDDGRGEGYHRSTTHEARRAQSSSSRHLKQRVRRKNAFARLKAFRKIRRACQ